jgi:hypothetical protein
MFTDEGKRPDKMELFCRGAAGVQLEGLGEVLFHVAAPEGKREELELQMPGHVVERGGDFEVALEAFLERGTAGGSRGIGEIAAKPGLQIARVVAIEQVVILAQIDQIDAADSGHGVGQTVLLENRTIMAGIILTADFDSDERRAFNETQDGVEILFTNVQKPFFDLRFSMQRGQILQHNK